jgi:hypothetical protein
MASTPPKIPAATKVDLDRAWLPGDSIPLAEAVQKDTESVWALWNEATQQQDRRFAPTAPMSVPAPLSADKHAWAATQPQGSQPAALAPRPVPPLYTLESALLMARRNNRVCPRPERWSAFCALLPSRKTLRGTLPPPAAITGGAWAVTPPLTKRLTFREQLEWADREGVLEVAVEFLQALSEPDWLHMGED